LWNVLSAVLGARLSTSPDAAAAVRARQAAAERSAHRLVVEVERLRVEGVAGQAALNRALSARGVAPPDGRGV
jgi:hypothetical protein